MWGVTRLLIPVRASASVEGAGFLRQLRPPASVRVDAVFCTVRVGGLVSGGRHRVRTDVEDPSGAATASTRPHRA